MAWTRCRRAASSGSLVEATLGSAVATGAAIVATGCAAGFVFGDLNKPPMVAFS
jgi:hypothetical protein